MLEYSSTCIQSNAVIRSESFLSGESCILDGHILGNYGSEVSDCGRGNSHLDCDMLRNFGTFFFLNVGETNQKEHKQKPHFQNNKRVHNFLEMYTLNRPGHARGLATEVCDRVYFPKIITATPFCLMLVLDDTLTLRTPSERQGLPPVFVNQQVCNFEGSNAVEHVYMCVSGHMCARTA